MMAAAVLLSRAFSDALVHFRVSRPRFAPRTEKKERLIIVVNIDDRSFCVNSHHGRGVNFNFSAPVWT